MKRLNEENIIVLEKYVSTNLKHLLENTVYSDFETDNFSFLPGHTNLLLTLPDCIRKFEMNDKTRKPNVAAQNSNFNLDSLPLSFLMKELIRSGIDNSSKDARHRKFSSVIQSFATYVYMMCGKACYEILSQNLPLPQANTICKLNQSWMNVSRNVWPNDVSREDVSISFVAFNFLQ